ncbi:hypothetical protein [Streptomyces sp. NPDC102462]|uniref:hypothetical protein n=1 Tax=Streptomyces sp. NPDC102462 TaxID=3366178 RepID=UPI0037F5896D
MTPPPASAATPVPAPRATLPRLDPRRRLLRSVAIVACVPYIGLKAAWLAGSRAGIPQGSPLPEHRTTMAVANALSVLLDAAVIVLAVVLTRPRARTAPAWAAVFPVWVGTGLLAPITAGYPLQLVVGALAGGGAGPADPGRRPFLDAWVFAVVYTGFIVQGLALGALFALYARDRWGRVWRGRMGDLPAGTTRAAQRACAGGAALAALLPLGTHLLWMLGGTAGLGPGRAAHRTSDFFVMEAVAIGFLLAAVTGGRLLGFRHGRRLPVAAALALAWLGSGGTACWGGWLSLAPLGDGGDLGDPPTQLMNLTYAGQLVTGVLVAALGAHFCAERYAEALKRPPA